MKILLTIIVICISFSSCAIVYGENYDNSKKVKNLYIGMNKVDAINVMGKDYIVESTFEDEDGLVEIIKYYSQSDVPYLLHFLNNKLVQFNRYYPPYKPDQQIVIKQNND